MTFTREQIERVTQLLGDAFEIFEHATGIDMEETAAGRGLTLDAVAAMSPQYRAFYETWQELWEISCAIEFEVCHAIHRP